MNTTLISSLIDHLAQLDFIKWIDIDEGQLEAQERPPVAFPCVLLDMGYPQCDMHNKHLQRISVAIELRVAFYPTGQTCSTIPKEVRKKSLARFDQLDELHRHLQGFRPEGSLLPLRRERATPERREDGIKVYSCVYITELMG